MHVFAWRVDNSNYTVDTSTTTDQCAQLIRTYTHLKLIITKILARSYHLISTILLSNKGGFVSKRRLKSCFACQEKIDDDNTSPFNFPALLLNTKQTEQDSQKKKNNGSEYYHKGQGE